MRDERFEVSVSFDPTRGYFTTGTALRTPVVALSLGGLRRRVGGRTAARRARRSTAARRSRRVRAQPSSPLSVGSAPSAAAVARRPGLRVTTMGLAGGSLPAPTALNHY
jgi:hypothetical protein